MILDPIPERQGGREESGRGGGQKERRIEGGVKEDGRRLKTKPHI